MRRAVALVATGCLLVSACTGDGETATTSTSTSTGTSTTTSTSTSTSTTTTTTEPLDQSLGPVAVPVRSPATARPIYFVMTDRFANGDPTNDTAGLDGDQLVHGFDPTDRGYHHGGDLIGLRERLPYLHGLGVRAIWITPPFTNRFVQGDGTVDRSSSSYHGYWQIDWSRIDPHLGTDDDMAALVDAAHELDMHVYFDIVVNHTGDVITYAEGSTVYRTQTAQPYVDAAGNEFDPSELAGSGDLVPVHTDLPRPGRRHREGPRVAERSHPVPQPG